MRRDKVSTVIVTERQPSIGFWKRAIADGEEMLSGTANPAARKSLHSAIGWFRKRFEWSLGEAPDSEPSTTVRRPRRSAPRAG